ncbi:MAG: hypothetical protein ACYC6C_07930 [Coriobacteriia bacterium]
MSVLLWLLQAAVNAVVFMLGVITTDIMAILFGMEKPREFELDVSFASELRVIDPCGLDSPEAADVYDRIAALALARLHGKKFVSTLACRRLLEAAFAAEGCKSLPLETRRAAQRLRVWAGSP